MRRGQLAISLVLLAIVAIIALIGLILLLIKPTGMAIGDIYGPPGARGIAPVYPVPPYVPGRAIEYPYPHALRTIGGRTPVMVFFKGEYGTLNEASRCWADLYPLIPNAQDKFSCYVLPTSGPAYEVTGWFPPSSSARPRPPVGFEGTIGGDIYCYENTPYDREQLLERVKTLTADKGWTTDTVNNQEVAVCLKGAYFLYPQ